MSSHPSRVQIPVWDSRSLPLTLAGAGHEGQDFLPTGVIVPEKVGILGAGVID